MRGRSEAALTASHLLSRPFLAAWRGTTTSTLPTAAAAVVMQALSQDRVLVDRELKAWRCRELQRGRPVRGGTTREDSSASETVRVRHRAPSSYLISYLNMTICTSVPKIFVGWPVTGHCAARFAVVFCTGSFLKRNLLAELVPTL